MRQSGDGSLIAFGLTFGMLFCAGAGLTSSQLKKDWIGY